jgi:hypothetical protein
MDDDDDGDDVSQPASQQPRVGVRDIIALIIILIVVIFCCVEILVRGRLPLFFKALMEEV